MTRAFLGVALVGLFLSGGCAATVRDGFFQCSRMGRCPPGQICGADGTCRSMGLIGDSGLRDGAPPDGTSGPDYPPCEDLGTCRSAAHECIRESGSSLGFCAPTCAGSADCPMSPRGPSVCIAGRCHVACRTRMDCPGLECISGRWDNGATAICVTRAEAMPVGTYGPCATSPDCPAPTECIQGGCIRTCGVSRELGCTPNESCQAGPGGSSVCLAPCIGTTCPRPEGACRLNPMGGENICVPPTWSPPG